MVGSHEVFLVASAEKMSQTSVKIIKNEVRCRDDTMPKTVHVDTRRHCEVDLRPCNNLPRSAFLYLQFLARCHPYVLVIIMYTVYCAGWIVYGTYALRQQPDCITALVYLILLYFYLFVFIGAAVVGVIWKLYDLRTGGKQSFKVNVPS